MDLLATHDAVVISMDKGLIGVTLCVAISVLLTLLAVDIILPIKVFLPKR